MCHHIKRMMATLNAPHLCKFMVLALLCGLSHAHYATLDKDALGYRLQLTHVVLRDANNTAYRATLRSVDGKKFTLERNTVSIESPRTLTGDMPLLTGNAGDYRLTIPHLQVDGTHSRYAATLTTQDLSTFVLDPASVAAAATVASSSRGTFPLIWQMDAEVRIPTEHNGQTLAPLAPDIVRLDDGRYRMYFNLSGKGVGSALSSDGLNWSIEAGLRLASRRVDGEPDFDLGHATVISTATGWRLYAQSTTGIGTVPRWISATSTDGLNFTREPGYRIDVDGKVLTFAGHGRIWRGRDGRQYGLFSANTPDDTGPSDIGGFYSADGLTLTLGDLHVFRDGHDPAAYLETDGSVTVIYHFLNDASYYSQTTDDGATYATPQPLLFYDTSGALVDYSVIGDMALTRLPDGGYVVYSNWRGNTGNELRSFRPVP